MASKASQSARRSKPSTQSQESANTDTEDTSSSEPARPSQLANAVGRSAGRTWWTRDRVVSGLRRFHLDHGLTPTSTEEWHRLTARRGYRGGGSGSRRPYPSFYAILRYFETFRQAWAAVGIDVGRRQESWSEIEDWYLREGVGVISRTELARDLQRTPNAVHRRMYDLGLHSYQRWGWTLNHVERVAQVPRHRLQTYLERGELPYYRGSKCVYVDPADLLVVREINWEHPPAEIAEAALHAWRERLVKVLAGLDWRVERPYRAQALTRTDRRWSPRLIAPAPKSVDIVAGDRVVVALPIPGCPYCLSRVGLAHLIFWSANRNWNNPARSNPEPQWMARVEFTSQHARSLGPRVSYTLPLANLQKVSEDGLLKGELSAHA